MIRTGSITVVFTLCSLNASATILIVSAVASIPTKVSNRNESEAIWPLTGFDNIYTDITDTSIDCFFTNAAGVL